MLRFCFGALSIAFVVTLGCGTSNPPPPPGATNTAANSGAPPPTVVVPSRSTAQPAPAPAQATSPFRDLAAQYLDSDAQGGWRKNEKAATELEKLSPDEVAKLWPLLKD